MAGVDVVTVEAPISSLIESLPTDFILSPVHNVELEQVLSQIITYSTPLVNHNIIISSGDVPTTDQTEDNKMSTINGTYSTPFVNQNIIISSGDFPTTDQTEDNKMPSLQVPNDNGSQLPFPSKYDKTDTDLIPVINQQVMQPESQELTPNELSQTPVASFDNNGPPFAVLPADNQQEQELSQIVKLSEVVPDPSIINQTQMTKEQSSDHNPCDKVFEKELLQAVTAHDNQVTPLIKAELRNKIKFRRESQGLKEIKVEFKPPPKYELRPEEVVKREKRKQRNRRSAHISRENRKSKEKTLEKMVEDLEKEKVKRTKIVDGLRAFEEKLRSRFADHLIRCREHKIKRLLQNKTIPG